MEEDFGKVETYLTFIGYPRSGHSLVGSLLDAHPDAVVAHELDALEHVQAGVGRDRLYEMLVESSREFTVAGREWEGYGYQVPDQWQGSFRRLRVIGDKKGAASTRRLADNPDLLERLRDTVSGEMKFVHVIRNPYDNVSTMFNRRRANRSLRATIKKYFALCEANADLKDRLGESVFDLKHEEFVQNPKLCLGRLCEFLGLEKHEDYLEDCASLVFGSPRKTRHETQWNAGALERLGEGMGRYDFLKDYSFES